MRSWRFGSSGDQQVRLRLGMLLYVGCSFRSLSNRFFIHRVDSLFQSRHGCSGVLFAVIKRLFPPNPERLSKTESAGATLMKPAGFTLRAASGSLSHSVRFIPGCNANARGLFLF